ncbi:MAG: hypothetical protein JW788_07630, partial [Candidatus Omnitrophica bacterium]|nr:hypothetical protein [Candidatus Omnitrophota bacterium]
FCMFIVPSRHGWVPPGGVRTLLRSFILLLKEAVLLGTVLVILATGYIRRFMHKADAPERIKTLLSSAPWPMLFIVSIFMIPTSILGRSKLGGSANTLSPALYFLAFSVTALLLDSISAFAKYGISAPRKSKILLLLLLAGLSCFVIYYSRRDFVMLDNLPCNSERLAYEFAKMHPHKAYFPFSPVSGLLAEKRLYHFYGGLDDKEAAGFSVGEKNFLSYIPADVEMVVFPKNCPTGCVLNYLPDFSKRICVDDLPGHVVYARE